MANTKIPVELSSTPGIVDGSNATAITINSNEQVGLGTTPPTDTHATWSQFFIGQKGSLISEKSGTGGIYGTILSDNLYIDSDTGSPANIVTNESSAYIQEAGSHKFYSQASGSAGAAVTLSEKMRIDSSGQIGVGTTSPQRQFHIAGGSNTGLKISGNNTGSASGDGFDIFVRDDNSGVELVQRENTFMTFHTNNTERMRIDASGNLGIGTTPASASSTTRMHIHNGTSTAILQLTGAGVGTTDSDGTELAADDNGDFRIRNFESGSMQFFNNGSERMRIDSGGNLLVGQTTLNYNAAGASMGSGGLFRACVEGGMVAALNRRASDGVILNFYKDGSTVGSKRDISDLDLGLNLVTKLKPSQFRYKISDEDSPIMYGLIAQDLEESLTEVGIEKNSTWLLQHEPKNDEKQSDYSLDYLKLTPVLIKAIQEQQELIETLQAKVEALENG
jgi:hypothetical protein